MNTPTLYDILSQKLEQKRKDHPSFKLLDIDENLFPNGIITFETEAKDSNNKLKSVKDIVAESWKKGEKNHLMIQGEGGIGKTVTLLCLPVMFNDIFVPAIYIPLHELKGGENDDLIESYIKKRVLDDDEELVRQLKELRKKEWNNGPNLLLLLDGFNEISNEHRAAISENIEQWSEYPGIQIITSSRFDIHLYVSLRSNFSKIELQPLSEDTVLGYLKSNDIDAPKTSTVTKLITIPLMLTLYIKTETVRKQRPAPLAKFLETKNAGTLIWNYLQSELWRFRNNSREGVSCVLAMEFIAPYVAWNMQQHSEFFINESSFLDRIGEAYNLMKNHIDSNGVFPEHIKTTLQQSTVFADDVGIGKLLKESLCLFIGNEGHYRLMHQQFRDALAAMHLINSIYLNGDSRPMEWNSTVDHYVMQFVVDLISKDEANRLWEHNRTSPPLEAATRNQLELQRRLHDYDFSTLNFSGLDLSNISLFPYRAGNAILQLPAEAEAMNGVKLSEISFSPEGHTGPVCAMAVTTDGKRIVSGSGDNSIRIWDLETGACLKTLEGHEGWVRAVALTSDGKHIVSGSDDNTLRVWDMDTGACLKTLKGQTGDVNAVAVTTDGKQIVSGSDDHTICLWDLETGVCLKTLEGHEDGVKAVAVTSDGKRIVSGSRDSTIRVWDMDTGACLKTLKGQTGDVNAVAVTTDGKQIVSGSDDHTICVWDLETGVCLKTLEGHKDWVTAVTTDGKSIVSGSKDSTIRVWDMDMEACLKTLEVHRGYVSAVVLTSDGKSIISSSYDLTICVWDMETGASLKTLEGYSGSVNAVAVTSDVKRIVSGSEDNTICVWDLETGVCQKTLEGHTYGVNAVAVTSDGKHIISGSDDHTIRVWKMDTGACIKTLIGHTDDVNAVAVTTDGKRIVSGSYDRIIRVWDLDTGACLKTLNGHTGSVNTVAVTSDGKRIVSGSDDNTIRVWDMESGDCLITVLILPLLVVGLDFSKAIISTPELKEQLRQNGAKV